MWHFNLLEYLNIEKFWMNLFESTVWKISNKTSFVGNFLGLLERFEGYWNHLSIAPKFPWNVMLEISIKLRISQQI
jgi:hypothetical protein